jgi:poly-gamma-glutamate capsule biosynthesis protein CapA/YwtB (metallophosphatase superfamily)
VKPIIKSLINGNLCCNDRCLCRKVVFLIVAVSLTFINDTEAREKPDSNGIQTIVGVGDIMLSGSAKPLLRKKGYDYPFGDIELSKLIRNADLAFANLECPVTKKGKAFKDKKYVFRADPASMKAVRRAGFDMLSLANNHIMDYGAIGLSSTLNYCLKSGLACSGAGMDIAKARTISIIKKNGITYGLLSYSMTYPGEFWATSENAGTAFGEKLAVIEDVVYAKKEADVVIVSFHWGAELAGTPKGYQIKMAHTAIDCGADIVFGHHPHVPQPVEIYKGKPVFYSLGNYAFGSYSRKTPMSFAAGIDLDKDRICSVRLYPVIVDNYEVMFKPAYAGKGRAKEIICYLNEISRPFGTVIVYKNGVGIVDMEKGGKKQVCRLVSDNIDGR